MFSGQEKDGWPSTVSILIAKADSLRKCFDLWAFVKDKAEYAKTILL
jgi:hypothetical protein